MTDLQTQVVTGGHVANVALIYYSIFIFKSKV